MHVQSASKFNLGFRGTTFAEAIAALQVGYRHVMRPSHFLGVTTGVTFTGAGQSVMLDLCRHSESRPPSNRLPMMLEPQTDPSSWHYAEVYVHARWCPEGA